MTLIKTTFIFILSLILGFGAWYLIGWLLSNESNLLLWPIWGKIFYLILGYIASDSIDTGLNK